MTQTDDLAPHRKRAETFIEIVEEETGAKFATANEATVDILERYFTGKLQAAAEGRLPISTTLTCADGDKGVIGFRSNQEVPDPSVVIDPQRVPDGLRVSPVICLPAETPSDDFFW